MSSGTKLFCVPEEEDRIGHWAVVVRVYLGWTAQLVKALVHLNTEYFLRLEKQVSDLWDSIP